MNDFSSIWSSQTITPSSWLTILFSLLLAFVVGLFIAFIYRKNYRGVMYSNNFTLTLVLMTLITCPVVMCIRESIALSMGMVGALSIVRFRTAIKEPLDIVFLFWAIAAGIVLAAGLIPLAVISSAIIGVILILFVNKKSHVHPYILVLQCDDHAAEKRAQEYLKQQVVRSVVKNKTVQAGSVELNLEVRLKNDNTDFVNALSELSGVRSAVLVSYNGDYMG